jgi:hypothetical protein
MENHRQEKHLVVIFSSRRENYIKIALHGEENMILCKETCKTDNELIWMIAMGRKATISLVIERMEKKYERRSP